MTFWERGGGRPKPRILVSEWHVLLSSAFDLQTLRLAQAGPPITFKSFKRLVGRLASPLQLDTWAAMALLLILYLYVAAGAGKMWGLWDVLLLLPGQKEVTGKLLLLFLPVKKPGGPMPTSEAVKQGHSQTGTRETPLPWTKSLVLLAQYCPQWLTATRF